MRLSSSSDSPSKWRKGIRSGSRLRKKHKRLDAISEEAYNQNHGEGNAGGEEAGDDLELRRSSRVRRPPVILDASPAPPRKRQRINKNVDAVAASGSRSNAEGCSPHSVESPETEGSWRSRLRARGRNAGARLKESGSPSGKRKLFREIADIEGKRMVVKSELDEKKGKSKRGGLTVVKSKRLGRIKASNGSEDSDKESNGSEEGEKAYDDSEDSEKVSDGSEDSEKVSDGSEDSDKASDGSDDGEKASAGSEDSDKASDGSDDGEKASAGSEDSDKDSAGSDDGEKASIRSEDSDKDSDGSNDGEKASIGSEDSDKDSGGSEDSEKALSVSEEDGDKEIETLGIEDHNEMSEIEVTGNKDEEVMGTLEGGVGGENEKETVDGNATQAADEGEREAPTGPQLVEDCNGIGNGNVEPMEVDDKLVGKSECIKDGENKEDVVEVVETLRNQAEDRRNPYEEEASLVGLNGKPVEVNNAVKLHRSTRDRLGKPRIKEGRRCGLCGGGTDGKPPKKLAHDTGESENETYSGSSASEEPNYDVWDGFGDEPGWLGRLLGPINDRYGIAGIWVHQHCAVWSPEVYFAGLGCLKNIRAALCRGKALKCTRCGRPGATIGCRVDRCPKTYHLPCARANGCIFDHRKFLIACTDHRHLFQPHGNQHLFQIKKMKTKKMKLELRKSSNDAWRKDIEAEEKWLENCGEDEEFLKRESKRLHRDLLRIAPVYIGGPNSENGKLFQGWESVAGLQNVIQCMKEVVILPLLYPEFFGNLGLTPPRGVLLHGYPGTGKTLVVRALIGSCARGDRRIAYFARKGADCLGKYVGDAERQLRLLFQVAEKCQPSIIFFDEIDGLAPCRTRQQDQTHSSVVSTLLALLDGLKSRGSVVVIGATNRPEAVDPALRRPGRFDREIYFPLPSVEDRAAILSLHTKKWPKPVSGSLLKWIANKTIGFAGADLQALCTQAAMIALKRNFPLQETLSAAEKKGPQKRLPLPAFAVEERDWLEALSCAPPPCSRREAGMAANDVVSSPLPAHLISCLLQPLSVLLVSLSIDEHLWLPPAVSKAATMIKDVIVSALGKKKMLSDQWWSFVSDFLQDEEVAKEIENKLLHAGILHGDASSPGTDVSNVHSDDNSVIFDTSSLLCGLARPSLLKNMSLASRQRSGFQVLISGSPKSGQRHLASCLLHCYVGNVEIHKVDLATASQEGHGDVVQGITLILTKCASVGPCVVFMPRIDLWAVVHSLDTESSKDSQVDQENDSCKEESAEVIEAQGDCKVDPEKESDMQQCNSVETIEAQGACQVDEENESSTQQCESSVKTETRDDPLSISHEWSIFVEQLNSLRVSSPLMILATSDLPYPLLPKKIRKFFKGDILNCSRSTTIEYTVPRFCVEVDGNFNHDMVINLSAAALSRELIQQFVQLIHQKKHTHISSRKKYKIYESLEGTPETANQSNDPILTKELEEQTGGPDDRDTSFKGPPPPNIRTMKGKSSLLLALSTFGYQILRYPHFAELCWFTSKLKEGPCVDISGPWKGWPFNSCITRPNNSSEKVAVACSSSNVKSKEIFGLVRGLIAVGLSAYRGVYTSLREVSFEVRKVLELVVERINVKVQAGKDRHQYVRLLSQVAYMEDMVNSWAHALQSLESDSRIIEENPKQIAVDSSLNHNTGGDNPVQNMECQPSVANQSSHELKSPEEASQQAAAENSQCIDLSGRNGDAVDPNVDGRDTITIPLDSFQQKHVPLDDSVPVKYSHSSGGVDQLIGKRLNEQNNTSQQSDSDTVNYELVHGDSGSLRRSNGSAFTDSAVLSDARFSTPREDLNGILLTESGVASNDDKHKPNRDTCSVDPNLLPRKETSPCDDPEILCVYHCCSECVHTLNGLMQKILVREWGLNGNCGTVEDVHDAIASLSVDLLSAVRKSHVSEILNTSFESSPSHINHELFERLGLRTCQCKIFGGGRVLPIECSCHSTGGSVNATANTYQNAQTGLGSKFIFRDGVLGPVDVDKDVSFHCKFETLCLCSLIESIVMTKQLSD